MMLKTAIKTLGLPVPFGGPDGDFLVWHDVNLPRQPFISLALDQAGEAGHFDPQITLCHGVERARIGRSHLAVSRGKCMFSRGLSSLPKRCAGWNRGETATKRQSHPQRNWRCGLSA